MVIIAVAIGRLCSAKNPVDLISAFLVKISIAEFYVYIKDPIDGCVVHLSMFSFW